MSYVQRPFIVASQPYTAAGLMYRNPGGILDSNAAYTVLGWIRVNSVYGFVTPTGGIVNVGRFDAGDDTRSCDALLLLNGTGALLVGASDGTGYAQQNDTTSWKADAGGDALFPLDYTDPLFWADWDYPQGGRQLFNWGLTRWVHVALVRESATELRIYVDGTLRQTFNSHPTLTRTPADSIILGARRVGTAYEWSAGSKADFAPSAKFAYWRAFTAALSPAEIAAEMGVTRAVTAGCYADWPLTVDLTDLSGNSRTLATLPGTPDSRLASSYSYTGSGGPAINHVYEWDADVPSGLVDPTPPESGIAVPLRGRPSATPQLRGLARAGAAGAARAATFPRLAGIPNAYPLPEE